MEYSKSTKEDLLTLRATLLKQIAELQRRIQAIDVILPELSITRPTSAPSVPVTPNPPQQASSLSVPNLRGLKQMPALKAIARANGGIVRTLEAKDILVEAGVVGNTKNAYKMVYNLIKNSDEFQPTGNRGEYRLTEATQPLLQ